MTVGQAFKKTREKKGYSRQELAEYVGVHFNSILNWEQDKNYTSLFLLLCVADLFECSLDELVGRKTKGSDNGN